MDRATEWLQLLAELTDTLLVPLSTHGNKEDEVCVNHQRRLGATSEFFGRDSGGPRQAHYLEMRFHVTIRCIVWAASRRKQSA